MRLDQFRERWLGPAATRRGRLMPPNRRRGPRLCLEQLEDRTVPSNFNAASVSDLIADINAANLTAEADTITLVAGKTFTLTAVNNSTDGANGLPVVAANENLTIIGNGDVIERSTAKGMSAFRLFDVAAGGSLTLQNLTLQGGLAFGGALAFGVSAQGAAVYSQGTLILNGVTVQNNTAQGQDGVSAFGFNLPGYAAAGGGLYSSGILTVTGCTIYNNAAIGGRGVNAGSTGGSTDGGVSWPASPGGSGYGGGFYVAGGTVTISGSNFTQNTALGGAGGDGANGGNGFGGGLYAAGGTVTVQSSSVTSNTAQGGAGGGKGNGKGAAGQGIGGGIYIAPGASVGLDAFTIGHVKKNHASTSDNDIYGSYDVIL
jgi:hypothetical protein